jgi:hypothetical protein
MDAEDFTSNLYDGGSAVDQRVGQLYATPGPGLARQHARIITTITERTSASTRLMDHVYSLHTLLHVPLIVGARRIPGRTACRRAGADADIFPTILAGRDHRGRHGGRSNADTLSPTCAGSRADRDRRYLEPQPPVGILRERYPEFDALATTARSARCAPTRHKYVWASDGNDELYRVASDPGEERNLIEAEPEVAARLGKSLEAWLASFSPATVGDEELELDAAMRSRLEDLGYLA